MKWGTYYYFVRVLHHAFMYYLLLLEGAAKGDKFNPAMTTKDREYDVRFVDAPSANISLNIQSNELSRFIV